MFGLRWIKKQPDVVLDFFVGDRPLYAIIPWRDRSRKSLNIERSQLKKWAIAVAADAFVADSNQSMV
jgi:hypothetical protein